MNDPATESTLDHLVARTEGAQPWRNVFHAVNSLIIASALLVFGPSRPAALLVLGGASTLLLATDLLRLAVPRANELFFRTFSRLASPREMSGLASSTWYALGVTVAVGFFDRPIAMSAVLVLGLADPAAAYVGRTWGRRPFIGGTAEGSLAFFGTAVVILAMRHGFWVALPTALAATVIERRSWPLDDNFTIPVGSAAIVAALALPG